MEPAPVEPGDEDLVARILADPRGADGRAAARELYGRHQRRVYLWCRRYVPDHEQALDVAQEVLMSAHLALATFEGRARFTSWLFAIARHRCLRAVAARRPATVDAHALESLVDPDDPPDVALEREQDREQLLALVNAHLDEAERTALWLSLEERMPVDQITRVLGLGTASGARGLLQRARRRLRAAMQRDDAGRP
jgi:RNA polymerase sigma-70 factor (ECF subfamily)